VFCGAAADATAAITSPIAATTADTRNNLPVFMIENSLPHFGCRGRGPRDAQRHAGAA
jgi:hypothetical protein